MPGLATVRTRAGASPRGELLRRRQPRISQHWAPSAVLERTAGVEGGRPLGENQDDRVVGSDEHRDKGGQRDKTERADRRPELRSWMTQRQQGSANEERSQGPLAATLLLEAAAWAARARSRSLHVPTAHSASATIARDIFDSPSDRSRNVIGTSPIENPSLQAR
jgi:hypothetical protein